MRIDSSAHILTAHPTTPCAHIHHFTARVGKTANGWLSLQYSIEGDLTKLCVPDPCSPQRADALWRHTCCEAFLAAQGQTGYYEFNVAPSTAWAVYHFEAYRTGMAVVELIHRPTIKVRASAERLELEAVVPLAECAVALERAHWRLALSAVIEEQDGRCSYWAVRHSPGPPDFHHPDSFALALDGVAPMSGFTSPQDKPQCNRY